MRLPAAIDVSTPVPAIASQIAGFRCHSTDHQPGTENLTTEPAFGCRILSVFKRVRFFRSIANNDPQRLECRVPLQRFPKRFLRLVMLVPVPLVKHMCSLSNHIRPHRHPFAFLRARPGFSRFQQSRTGPTTPSRCANHESIDLSSQRNLEQIRNAHMNPPDDFAAIFSNKNRMQRRRLHATESHLHLRRRRRIPKVPRQLRKPRNIARSSSSNF
jgi:hypothetical protein